MNCPYCNAVMSKGDRKCPRCGKRVVSEEEYYRLISETEVYKEKQEKFKLRVAVLFNCLFPGLGVFVKTGNITLFLLMLVLYGGSLALTIWTFVTGKGTPFILIAPLAMHAISLVLLFKEQDK